MKFEQPNKFKPVKHISLYPRQTKIPRLKPLNREPIDQSIDSLDLSHMQQPPSEVTRGKATFKQQAVDDFPQESSDLHVPSAKAARTKR